MLARPALQGAAAAQCCRHAHLEGGPGCTWARVGFQRATAGMLSLMLQRTCPFSCKVGRAPQGFKAASFPLQDPKPLRDQCMTVQSLPAWEKSLPCKPRGLHGDPLPPRASGWKPAPLPKSPCGLNVCVPPHPCAGEMQSPVQGL